MAPYTGTQPRKLAVTFPPPQHTTMAPCNGTQQQHHVHSPKVGRHPPPNHSTLQWLPTMAPSNGALRLHPAMAPRPLHPALAPWCHVQSAKVVRRPPPLLEVRTPIAIAIWGNYEIMMKIYQKQTCNVIQFNQVWRCEIINHLQNKWLLDFCFNIFQGCETFPTLTFFWFFISALLVVFVSAKRQWVGEAPEASTDEAPWPWFLKETDRNWGTSHLVFS